MMSLPNGPPQGSKPFGVVEARQAQSLLTPSLNPMDQRLQIPAFSRPESLRRRSWLNRPNSSSLSEGEQRPESLERRHSEPELPSALSTSWLDVNIAKSKAIWTENRGVALVLIAQLFGALMNVTARILEDEGQGMRPLQILNARMGITVILSMLYMWLAKVQDSPLGKKEVRALLLARGIGGFFGVYGLYCKWKFASELRWWQA